MENITFVTDIDGAEHAVIAHEDGSFTSMPKAIYDAMIEDKNNL
jgi:hypothetical protein